MEDVDLGGLESLSVLADTWKIIPRKEKSGQGFSNKDFGSSLVFPKGSNPA